MATITEIVENVKNGNRPNLVTLVTHKSSTSFHADDVSATALLRILFDVLLGVKTQTVHTFNPAEEGYTDETPNCIVYDIGLGMYDHHQPDGQNEHCLREDPDGVIRKYSSVGLIWKEAGKYILPEEYYINEVYKNLIKFIDDNDNGFESNPLSFCIRCMNCPPNRVSKHDTDDYFEYAVNSMITFFTNVFNTYLAKKEEEDEITSIINAAKVTNNGKYVVSDHYLAGMVSACAREQIPFYIYPNVRDNGYCFRTITPVGGEMNDHIVDIPQDVRNWEGVTFLHPSAFLGSAVSKARAIEIVETILSNNK